MLFYYKNSQKKFKMPLIAATTCWIISPKGLIGTENQCIGVAQALGVKYEVKRIALNQPWRGLSPYLGFESSFCFSAQGDKLEAPWPDLIIAAGRRAIAAVRYIRNMSDKPVYCAFLQDPKCSGRDFDLIAAPRHDQLHGTNVIASVGAANKITPELLASEKETFSELFSPLPAPRVGILIGGNSKTHRMTTDICLKLAGQIQDIHRQHGCGLMITASRRTGERNKHILQRELSKLSGCFFWDGQGDNPYLGILAWADHLLVTEDSVSMLCDAGTTGTPTYRIALEGRSKKFDRLYRHLEKLDIARPFEGHLENWKYKRLDDAGMIAARIRENMDLSNSF